MFISLDFFLGAISQWIFLAILLLDLYRTASVTASALLSSSVPAINPCGTDMRIRNHPHLFDTHTTSGIEWTADIPPFLFQCMLKLGCPFLSLNVVAHCYKKCPTKEAMEGFKYLLLSGYWHSLAIFAVFMMMQYKWDLKVECQFLWFILDIMLQLHIHKSSNYFSFVCLVQHPVI